MNEESCDTIDTRSATFARELEIMAITPSIDIGTLITRTPGVRDSLPCIAGTAVSVMRIANYHNMGYTAEEIADGYGHITLAQVYAAITYYYANKDEIDTDISEEQVAYDRYEKEYREKRDRDPA
ncbi:MAG TPA: DUF433 domain-containing protein [Chloroflexia bacterium]|jgi:uncharacterized protein (DUF433 family)